MILDTMTYSIMAVVVAMSFIVILLAWAPQGKYPADAKAMMVKH